MTFWASCCLNLFLPLLRHQLLIPVGFLPPTRPVLGCVLLIGGCRRLAVARYRMIFLVLVNSHLYPLPCGAGSTVPCERFNLSVFILASLLVCPMLGYRHSLLRLSNISHVSQVTCTFSNIFPCEHLPVGVHYLFAFGVNLLSIKVYCRSLLPILTLLPNFGRFP